MKKTVVGLAVAGVFAVVANSGIPDTHKAPRAPDAGAIEVQGDKVTYVRSSLSRSSWLGYHRTADMDVYQGGQKCSYRVVDGAMGPFGVFGREKGNFKTPEAGVAPYQCRPVDLTACLREAVKAPPQMQLVRYDRWFGYYSRITQAPELCS